MSQTQRGETDKPVLKAVVRDVRTFALILRAVAFTPLCQVAIGEYGLQVITQVNGVLQATAYLSAGLFNSYAYHPQQRDIDEVCDDDESAPSSSFETSLNDLLVCLNIYGNAGLSLPGKSKEKEEDAMVRKEREKRASLNGDDLSTEMKVLYEGRGYPLILELQEGSTSTRCELATYEANDALIVDMPFYTDRVVGQVIMASKDLTDALQSIDATSQAVTISFSNDSKLNHRRKEYPSAFNTSVLNHNSRAASSIIMSTADQGDGEEDEEERELGTKGQKVETVQMMRIKSEGDNGSTELELPNQNKVFELFTCSQNCSNTYQFTHLQRCLKALQTSLKSSIRIDDEGMMNLQCLFPKRIEQAMNPHLDAATINNQKLQSDPVNTGYVELKILPVFNDEDQD